MLHLQLKSHRLPKRGVVLHPMDWVVPSGGLTVVVGPNGAGKSTLLRLLAGWELPSEGDVLWNGCSLSHFSAAELAKVRVFLPQDATRQIPALSVRQVVSLGCGREIAIRESVIQEAMEWMGLLNLADIPYTQLSGGEQQRTHVARSRVQLDVAVDVSGTSSREAETVSENEALPINEVSELSRTSAWGVFDEPLQGLDLRHQKAVLTYWKSWAKENCTVVVMSLHQLDMTAQYADTVLLLGHGRVIAQGLTRDVLQPELLESAYGTELD